MLDVKGEAAAADDVVVGLGGGLVVRRVDVGFFYVEDALLDGGFDDEEHELDREKVKGEWPVFFGYWFRHGFPGCYFVYSRSGSKTGSMKNK